MNTFLIMALGILAIEFFIRKIEKGVIKKTKVSSIKESDYTYSKVTKILRSSAVIIVCILLAFFLLFNESLIIAIVLTIIFISFRIFLLTLTQTLSKLSVQGRFVTVLDHSIFTSAQFAFYFSSPDLREPTHVDMWIGPLNSLNLSWYVILRERKHLDYFIEKNSVDAILVEKDSDLKFLLSQQTNTVFYANNGQKNRTMIALEYEANHVQLLHGDSDKPPSYSPLSKNYDYLFVAGQMAIDRYKDNGIDIPDEKFRIVGRPQVSAITSENISNRIQTIGYMPTWRGFYEDTEFSSLDRAAAVIKKTIQTLDNKKLLFKPHPMSFKDPQWPKFRRDISSALSNHGRFAAKKESAFDVYNISDILISDISSVMIDYLYSGKPLIVILPKSFTESDSLRFPSLNAAYLVDADLNDLGEVLTLVTTTDPMQEKRKEMRQKAFGDFGRPVGEAFREACLEIINTQKKLDTDKVKYD